MSGDQAPDLSKHTRPLSENLDLLRLGIADLDDSDKKWCHIETTNLQEEVIRGIEVLSDFVDALTPQNVCFHTPPQVVYVPVLRTPITLTQKDQVENRGDILSATIIANYQLEEKPEQNRKQQQVPQRRDVEVFTGNLLDWIIYNDKLGEATALRRLNKFEDFLEANFLLGKKIEFTPSNRGRKDKQHLRIFVNDIQHIPIHDWGDGIQAIIVMMYRIFTAEDKSWIFIEEPEQGLHPGLQRTFLHCLATNEYLKSKELTIFMTTHSNHLLGIALSELKDVSVLAFQERGFPGPFEVRSIFAPEANLLDLLGTSNTSVFLANCGIWVEGITDRRYLRAYLDAYLSSNEFTSEIKPREDIHYGFFEYAGSNLAHYLFGDSPNTTEQIRARFLSNRVFLLADKDKGKAEKHERLKSLQNERFVYEVTPGKEIENLISVELLKLALPQLIPGLLDTEIDHLAYNDYQQHETLSGIRVK